MAKTTFLVFLFILSFFLTCSKNNIDPTELEPIDLSEIDINDLPHKFKIIQTLAKRKDDEIFCGDLDNDGKDEIITVSNSRDQFAEPSWIYASTYDPLNVIFYLDFKGLVSSLSVFDIYNDGHKEIFLSELGKDTSYVYMLSSKGDTLHKFIGATNPHLVDNKWECHIQAKALMDINSDGVYEVIFLVHTTNAYQPRGLFCYDFKNQKKIWEFETGYVPYHVQVFDINGDNKREILFGSAAPKNGAGIPINGHDDSEVFLTVIDTLGTLVHSQPIGARYSTAHLLIHDINSDGEPEIIINYSSQTPQEKSNVALWNYETWNLAPSLPLEQKICHEIAFLDVNKDGNEDVLIAYENGKLEFRDYQFETIISKEFVHFRPTNLFILDFNTDGEKEIVVSGEFNGKGVILLFDNKMNILAFINRDYKTSNLHILDTGYGKEKLIVGCGTDKKVLMKITRHYKIISIDFCKKFGQGLIVGIILTGIIFGFYFSSKYRSKLNLALHLIFDTLTEGVALLNNNKTVFSINQSFEKITKLKNESIMGLSYDDVFSTNNLHGFRNIINKSFMNNHSLMSEEIIFKQNGNSLNLIIEIGNIKLANYKKPFKLLIIRDITSSVRSTRTIAWATMAQKLAHEIKTPLSTVRLTAQRLELGFKDDAKLNKEYGKYLSKIIRQVDRLRQLTDSFMKFAKIEKPKVEKLNLNNLIANALNDLQTIIGINIEIRKEFTKDIPLIRIDRNQILIAIKNIVNNSLKAMDGAGILTITTRLVQSLQKQPGQTNIQIEITDTGSGISKPDMRQLFQPFFSKSPGGTGLGLVIAKKIIEDHNGIIKIESEVGIGTTVFINLPWAD